MSPQVRFWLEAAFAGLAVICAAPLVFVATRTAEQHPAWWYLGYMAFTSIVILTVLDRRSGRS